MKYDYPNQTSISTGENLLKTLSGPKPKNWVTMIYGVPGSGKSSLASMAPKPIFLDLEAGADRIDCVRYQADDWPDDRTHIKTWDELITALREVYKSDFETVVIDTMSACEEILTQKILDEVNADRSEGYEVTSLADKKVFSYGRGFEVLKAEWSNFMKMLFKLKDSGKNVLCIAHETTEIVENPEGDNYTRFVPNLHKKSIPIIIAKMDAVLFAQYEKVLTTKGSGDKKVAKETGRRHLHTVEKPTYAAKNRFGLPEVIDFTGEKAKGFFEVMK